MDGLVAEETPGTVVLSARSLPVRKLGKVRRVQVVPPSPLGEGEVERLVLKEGAQLRLQPPEGQAEVLIAEQGTFTLTCGDRELALQPEEVAWVRAPSVVRSPQGGVLYWVQVARGATGAP